MKFYLEFWLSLHYFSWSYEFHKKSEYDHYYKKWKYYFYFCVLASGHLRDET